MAFYAGRALQPVPAGWLSGAAGLGVSWKGTAWLPLPVLVWVSFLLGLWLVHFS